MSENELALNINTINAANVGTMICSIKPNPDDRATSAKIYAAMNDPEYKLADFINKKIEITDYLIEIVDIANEETGEVSTVPRVVLIDKDGKSYQATSYGIANSVRNLCMSVGDAPWTPPLKLEVKQKAIKRGFMLTLKMIP